MKMQQQNGFTLIELIVVIALSLFVTSLFWVQKSDVNARGKDTSRKQDINAIYYYLEGISYPQQKAYPSKLDSTQLKGLDPDSLKDPEERKVNDKDSDYTYEPTGCQQDLCTGYKLTAKLEKEADFTKQNVAR